LSKVTGTDRGQTGVEVEWQLDAIDLRPVERWFAARSSAAPRRTASVGVTADGPREPVLESVPGLEAVAAPAKRLVDRYFDTPDWRLGRAGYVLRTRQRAGRFEATLKDLVVSTGGLRRRLEVTEGLHSADVAGLGSEGPVGRRVHALVGDRVLRQVLEVRTRRQPYTLEVHGAGVGEVALDDTVIVAGEERHRIRLQRVEVEVLPAWVASLSPLVERLRHDCGLQPATLSKFEAGLLGAGLVIPRAAGLGSTDISPASSVADVAYAVLRKDAAAMLGNEPGTRLGEDPEPLHQMRVATRRMRAALKLFESVLPATAVRLNEELGWLAGVLGAVRDLDIQLERIDGWTENLGGVHRQALDELGDLLVSHHAAARRALLETLDSRRYERLVSSLTSMLDRGHSRRRPPPSSALDTLPNLIAARHHDVVKAVRRAHRSGVAEDFHRLRIRCKRLRYAIEFTGDLYGSDVKRYAKHVAGLQDALGLIQDAETAANRLQGIALGPEGELLGRPTVFAMGMVAQRCSAEAASRLAQLPSTKGLLNAPGWNKVRDVMQKRRDEAAAMGGAADQAVAEAASPADIPGLARPAPPSLSVQALPNRTARSSAPTAAKRVTGPTLATRSSAPTAAKRVTGPTRAPRSSAPRPAKSDTKPAGRPQPGEPADKTVTPIRRRLAPG
jgi:triphosphatase